MLYFMIISGAFLVGVGINTALMNCIRNLVRDTEEMEDTDNSFLKQMKLRYKNCMRIGHEIRNTEAFAGKYMDKYTSYGLSFAAYEKIISVCGGICVVAAIAGAMLDRSRLLQYLLLGFLAMYVINGLKNMTDVRGNRRRITRNIVDYFENRFVAATEEPRDRYEEPSTKSVMKEEKRAVKSFTDEEKRIIDDILREYLG